MFFIFITDILEHMNHSRRIARKLLFCFIFLSIVPLKYILAQDGRALFQTNCASCHALNKDLTGPRLAGFQNRGPWSDRKQLYAWVHNPVGFMAKDPYT